MSRLSGSSSIYEAIELDDDEKMGKSWTHAILEPFEDQSSKPVEIELDMNKRKRKLRFLEVEAEGAGDGTCSSDEGSWVFANIRAPPNDKNLKSASATGARCDTSSSTAEFSHVINCLPVGLRSCLESALVLKGSENDRTQKENDDLEGDAGEDWFSFAAQISKRWELSFAFLMFSWLAFVVAAILLHTGGWYSFLGHLQLLRRDGQDSQEYP